MQDLNDLGSDVTGLARDAAYVVVGLGVLGFQRAQVERRELQRRLAAEVPSVDQRLAGVRSAVSTGVQRLDGVVEGASQLVESALEPLEDQLPPAARELAQKAREQAKVVRTHIRDAVTSVA